MSSRLTRAAMIAVGITVMGAAMASSLVLPTAQSLAGQWQVADGQQQCRVEFLVSEQQGTNGYELRDREQCLKNLFAAEVVGWRPAPDGIALLQADGSSWVFFSREGEVYTGAGLTLKAL